jgi:hypothetical protein
LAATAAPHGVEINGEVFKRLVLPELLGGNDAWPPPQAHVGLQLYEAMRIGMANAPRPLTEEERAEASRRHIEAGEARERESERLRDEAARRVAK